MSQGMSTSTLTPELEGRDLGEPTSPGHSPAHPSGMNENVVHSGYRAAAVPEEPLIDMRTFAAWVAVSESTVRKWVAKGPGSGLVPTFIRVNGQVRFRPADVRAYLVAKEVR